MDADRFISPPHYIAESLQIIRDFLQRHDIRISAGTWHINAGKYTIHLVVAPLHVSDRHTVGPRREITPHQKIHRLTPTSLMAMTCVKQCNLLEGDGEMVQGTPRKD